MILQSLLISLSNKFRNFALAYGIHLISNAVKKVYKIYLLILFERKTY